MKSIATITLLLTLAAPAFAGQLEDRIADGEKWVRLMTWVEFCTTDKEWEISVEERFDACRIIEHQLRNKDRCMYSPGVIGIWDGKHCR